MNKYIKGEMQKGSISFVSVFSVLNDKKVDETTINMVQEKLPGQPWPTGIHKQVATELGISNGRVSSAISALIARGKFRQQINGNLI